MDCLLLNVNLWAGEAALQALRGSTVGLGTDIGECNTAVSRIRIYQSSLPTELRWFGTNTRSILRNIFFETHSWQAFVQECGEHCKTIFLLSLEEAIS